MEKLKDFITHLSTFKSFEGEIIPNEPLYNKCTFKIGGEALLFLKPKNITSLQIIINLLLQYDLPYFILGGGSNIVFPDAQFEKVVISTSFLSGISLDEKTEKLGTDLLLLTCFCGTSMSSLISFCIKNSLTGLEKFAGLPGSVGGALFMNARCFEKDISEDLFSVTYLDCSKKQTSIETLHYQPEQWDYKYSPFQDNNRLILKASFALQKAAEKNTVQQKCKFYINERVSKGHFRFPSAGSVFKNNHNFGMPSGKLIDLAGLKGKKIGGAQIAPFHGNFIININKATQKDVRSLVELAQSSVKKQFGYILEPEIILL